jgi:hypothetical protein
MDFEQYDCKFSNKTWIGVGLFSLVTFTNETEDIKCGDDQTIMVAAGFVCLSKSNPTKPVIVCNRERDFPIRPR